MTIGSCSGLDHYQLQQQFPNEYKLWKLNKFYYRFPGGESQYDKVNSLLPLGSQRRSMLLHSQLARNSDLLPRKEDVIEERWDQGSSLNLLLHGQIFPWNKELLPNS